MTPNFAHKIVHSSAMYYHHLIMIHECSKKLLKMKNSTKKFVLTPSITMQSNDETSTLLVIHYCIFRICDFVCYSIEKDICGVLVGRPKAAPIEPYPVNMSQIMLMISGDVEPNPGPNPR